MPAQDIEKNEIGVAPLPDGGVLDVPSDGTVELAETRWVAATLARLWADNRTALTQAFIVLISMRVALSLVALLAVGFIPEQSGLHYTIHPSSNVLLDVWARWDSE